MAIALVIAVVLGALFVGVMALAANDPQESVRDDVSWGLRRNVAGDDSTAMEGPTDFPFGIINWLGPVN